MFLFRFRFFSSLLSVGAGVIAINLVAFYYLVLALGREVEDISRNRSCLVFGVFFGSWGNHLPSKTRVGERNASARRSFWNGSTLSTRVPVAWRIGT